MVESPSSNGLHRLAVFTALCTFVLIIAGALVTSRDAGLAVPDWPLSFGTLNPPRWYAIENVRTEHGHRVIAFCVAVMTAILALRIYRVERDPVLRRLGAAAAGLVLLQAALGGLRVLHLSIDLAMIHGCLGQMFFVLVVAIATMTSPRWRADEAREPTSAATSRLAVVVAALVIAQLVVGIVIRHMGEAARPLLGNHTFYLHLGLAGLVVACAVRLRAVACQGPRGGHAYIARRARLLIGIIVAQLALGVASFAVTETMRYDRQATLLESWLPTLHVALGAALLAAAMNLALHAYRARAVKRLRVHERARELATEAG